MKNNVDEAVIIKAKYEDLANIESVLKVVDLPSNEIIQHIKNFLILRLHEKTIATAGLEIYGKYAILRSFAVLPQYRSFGFGKLLLKKTINLAEELDVYEIFLLTETADKYFSKFGFEKHDRLDVPSVLKSTFEFTTPRCSSAVCMKYMLK